MTFKSDGGRSNHGAFRSGYSAGNIGHSPNTLESACRLIHIQLLDMARTVENRFTSLQSGFVCGETKKLDWVARADHEINRFQLDLDAKLTTFMALYQPMAVDLRFVVSCIRMTADLERIGDECAKIAKKMRRNELLRSMSPLFEYTLNHIGFMLQDMTESLKNTDAKKARSVIRKDKELDKSCNELLRESKCALAVTPQCTADFVNALRCFRSCERIGDHIKNIAEHVVYIAKAKDIRYKSAR